VEDDPCKRSEDQLIKELQFNHDFREGLPKKPPFAAYSEAEMQIIEVRTQFMKTDWKPIVTHNPIQRWKQRGERLRSQKNCANALQNFDSLKRDMEYL
jgi:hypothetical protein